MIRPLLLIILVIFVWLLFFSSFTKKTRAIVSGILFLICAVGLYIESSSSTAKQGRIELNQVVSCGTSAERAYRSNFNIKSCVQNNSKLKIKRLVIRITAQQCVDEQCTPLEAVDRTQSWEILANDEVTLLSNLAFDKSAKLSIEQQRALNWTTDIIQVWALN